MEPRAKTGPTCTSTAMMIIGIFSCLIGAAFLAFPKESVIRAIQQLDEFQRPQIWWLAILEWCVVASALLWASAAVLVLWRK